MISVTEIVLNWTDVADHVCQSFISSIDDNHSSYRYLETKKGITFSFLRLYANKEGSKDILMEMLLTTPETYYAVQSVIPAFYRCGSFETSWSEVAYYKVKEMWKELLEEIGKEQK